MQEESKIDKLILKNEPQETLLSFQEPEVVSKEEIQERVDTQKQQKIKNISYN